MSLKGPTTLDVARGESTSKVFANPPGMQRVQRVEQEKSPEKAWKEEGPKEELSKIEVESAVESINNAIEYINRALRFSIHEDTQRMMVRVVDIATDEVIKELPPEDVLDTVARIREMIGLLIDERA